MTHLHRMSPGQSGKVVALTDDSPVARRLTELGRRANVEVTPHTLRHTMAKNLMNADVSLEKVAALLGHSNLNTTRLYTMPSQADLDQTMTVLED